MKHLIYTCMAAAGLMAGSCIKNDIPYPVIELKIENMESGPVSSDNPSPAFTLQSIELGKKGEISTVYLLLDEQCDARNVEVKSVTYGCVPHNTTLTAEDILPKIQTSCPLTGHLDLSSPLPVTLSLYQDYEWQIVAEQNITYRFAIAGQIGESVIDDEKHTITVNMPKGTDLSHLTVTEMKLGPQGVTQYDVTPEELSARDFNSPQQVQTTIHEKTVTWTINAVIAQNSVTLAGAYAWSKVIWLYGEGLDGAAKMGFRYRKSGSEAWLEAEKVNIDGGKFSAHVAADAESTYEVRAYCNDEESQIQTVKTGTTPQLPNGSMEDWHTDNKIVYPFLPGENYWGTGNPGAKIGGKTLTQGVSDVRPGSTGKQSAWLKSYHVAVFGIGKFAAGNLFTGDYLKTAGTNGIIAFGRPMTQRPTALRFWMKGKVGKIDRLDSNNRPSGQEVQKGDPDMNLVYIALGNWTKEEYGRDKDGNVVANDNSPICVDTRSVATFFNPKSKAVIGYGERLFDKNVEEWTQVTIPVVYNDMKTQPTHIMVVCTASRWGDYFIGSTQSELWIDDMELLYDYVDPQTK